MKDPIARERIKAVDRRLTEAVAAVKDAVETATNALEKRLDGMNEFRAALKDQAARLITRAEVEALIAPVNVALERLEAAVATSAGKGAGASDLWKTILAVGAVVTGLVGLLVATVALFMGRTV